jgi:hypothetical protein
MSWREEEAQKNGQWTLWKEIVGTAIGLLSIAVPIVVGMVIFGADLKETVAVDRQRIVALEYQSNVVENKLDKISDKIDVIAQSVAADSAYHRER